MNQLVVDASVLLKGFAPTNERHAHPVQVLFDRIERAQVSVVAPELDVSLLTDDDQIVALASDIAIPLAAYA